MTTQKQHMQRWLQHRANEFRDYQSNRYSFELPDIEAAKLAVESFNNLTHSEMIEALELGRIWLEADVLL